MQCRGLAGREPTRIAVGCRRDHDFHLPGSLRIVDRHGEHFVALVKRGAIDRQGAALQAGRFSRLVEAIAGRDVAQIGLVDGVSLVPLEDDVVHAKPVVGLPVDRLVVVEADGDLPADPRVRGERIDRRGLVAARPFHQRGEPRLVGREVVGEVAHRTLHVVGPQGGGVTVEAGGGKDVRRVRERVRQHIRSCHRDRVGTVVVGGRQAAGEPALVPRERRSGARRAGDVGRVPRAVEGLAKGPLA